MKSLFLTIVFLAASQIHSSADPLPGWLGPDIAQLDLEKGTTAREGIAKIMDAIKSNQKSRVAVQILVSDATLDERKLLGELRLSKIPAVIALKYLADALVLQVTSDGFAWTLREKWEEPGDITVRTPSEITTAEPRTMGLDLKTDGTVAAISGPAWPTHPESKALVENNFFFLKASLRDIQTFDALLLLLRRGYKVPPINSEQPATQPAGKVPPKDQPLPPTSKDAPR